MKKLPAEYIYEPWTAPRSVQEAAGCIIGRDYPRPIVDHSVVSKRNIGRMKDARACQPGKKAGKRSLSLHRLILGRIYEDLYLLGSKSHLVKA